MSWHTWYRTLVGASAALLMALPVSNATEVFWQGSNASDNWFNPGNWKDGVAPANDGSMRIVFGDFPHTTIYYSSTPYEVYVEGLRFIGNKRPYVIYGSYDTTHIGAGGIVYAPALPVESRIFDAVQLTASQTWDIQGGRLTLEGPISDTHYDPELAQTVTGNFSITKTGTGTLAFSHAESPQWMGGLTIKDGTVALGPRTNEGYPIPSTAFGMGNLTIDSSTGGTPTLFASSRLAYEDYYSSYQNFSELILANTINLKGTLSTVNEVEVVLLGDVNLLSDSTIKSRGARLYVFGAIDHANEDNFKLTIDSAGAVILNPQETEGINNWTGGTHVEKGVLVFADDSALPDTGLITASSNGYVGYGSSDNVTVGFLSRFNRPNFFGTIGFDSASEGQITITNDINLDGFAASARLGSATDATLTGLITPQGADYRFGGGGGLLNVESKLTGTRSVVAESPSALPLTVRLANHTNDYTGSVTATHSAVIFGSSQVYINDVLTPVNADTGGTLTLGVGGYIGTEDETVEFSPQAFINRFAPGTVNGMIGFNSVNWDRVITTPLNFSAFTKDVYLGTTQQGYTDDGVGGGLTVSGLITTGNGGTDPYRFAGYKGGVLQIESPLTGSAGVQVGDPTSPATFGDFAAGEYSAVALNADNSAMTGDVVLNGGLLYLGHANALGQGTLVVKGMPLPSEWQDADGYMPAPALVSDNGYTFSNNISLLTRLNVVEYTNMTLSGKISGTGSLYIEEDASVTLANDSNDFSGGIYVASQGELEVSTDHATGTGKLGFGYSNGVAYFMSANPVIHGLESDNYGAYVNLEALNATLEIRQNFDTTFRGSLRADSYNYELSADASGRFLKTGTGTLRLDETYIYSYGRPDGTGNEVSLEIQQGTVVLANGGYIEGGVVKLTGGTLALDNYELEAPIVVQSGTIAGNGRFDTAITIGAGGILSPGLTSIGELGVLDIAHLELNSGGMYRWNIRNAEGPVNHDQIFVYGDNTLVVNATQLDPFTIQIAPLTLAGTAGILEGFDPSQEYSWMIMHGDVITGFDPAKFTIDTSLFTAHNSLAYDERGNGWFSLSQEGGSIHLNFTPVPEPSTYALIGLGLGIIGVSAWRKRCKST